MHEVDPPARISRKEQRGSQVPRATACWRPDLGRSQSDCRARTERPPSCIGADLEQVHCGIGLCVACPITGRIRGYPFEVAISDAAGVRGVVLADQARSLS